jgi:hypothetical protein
VLGAPHPLGCFRLACRETALAIVTRHQSEYPLCNSAHDKTGSNIARPMRQKHNPRQNQPCADAPQPHCVASLEAYWRPKPAPRCARHDRMEMHRAACPRMEHPASAPDLLVRRRFGHPPDLRPGDFVDVQSLPLRLQPMLAVTEANGGRWIVSCFPGHSMISFVIFVPISDASAATNSLDRGWNREGSRRSQNVSEADSRRRA